MSGNSLLDRIVEAAIDTFIEVMAKTEISIDRDSNIVQALRHSFTERFTKLGLCDVLTTSLDHYRSAQIEQTPISSPKRIESEPELIPGRPWVRW